MKKTFVLFMVLLSLVAAFLMGSKLVVAQGEDRTCVMHPQAGVLREKWVEPKALAAHLGHGDQLCPGNPEPPLNPGDNYIYYIPVTVFKYMDCMWCK